MIMRFADRVKFTFHRREYLCYIGARVFKTYRNFMRNDSYIRTCLSVVLENIVNYNFKDILIGLITYKKIKNANRILKSNKLAL